MRARQARVQAPGVGRTPVPPKLRPVIPNHWPAAGCDVTVPAGERAGTTAQGAQGIGPAPARGRPAHAPRGAIEKGNAGRSQAIRKGQVLNLP